MSAIHLKLIAVDDDIADRVLLERYLQEVPGYTHELLGLNGQEADFEELIAAPADAIFLDYRLGKDTGLDKLRLLRARGVRTPIVMLTGQGDEELVVALMHAGATDYLAKTRLSPESLQRVLRNTLKLGELERQAQLAEGKLRLAAKVFDNLLEGVMVTDADARVISINPAFTHISGYCSEDILGCNPNLLRSDLHGEAFFREMWAQLAESGQWRGEIWNKRKNGDVFLAWQTISVVYDAAGSISHYVSVLFDITERHRQEELVRHRAYHDGLTGLPNRQLFHDRLTQALLRAHREGEMLAVMFLDLDRFKEVNDRLGHDVGDQLLCEVARRIKACIREGDTVARQGGDEFVLLLPRVKRLDNLIHLAQKVLQSLHGSIRIIDHELQPTISIGISVFPADGDQPDALIKCADEAMYQAKQNGRNTYHLPARN